MTACHLAVIDDEHVDLFKTRGQFQPRQGPTAFEGYCVRCAYVRGSQVRYFSTLTRTFYSGHRIYKLCMSRVQRGLPARSGIEKPDEANESLRSGLGIVQTRERDRW